MPEKILHISSRVKTQVKIELNKLKDRINPKLAAEKPLFFHNNDFRF